MKITLCGSIAFYDEMLQVKKQLESFEHEVAIPPSELKNSEGKTISSKEFYEIRKKENVTDKWVWDLKEEAMRKHFQKVEWAEAILVLNYEKNNIPGYIGANTFIEMGLALYLNKKIFLYNAVPTMPYTEEIFGMKPFVLFQDLNQIK